MRISTVLLDAGGVILDESEHEAVRAETTVEVLSAIVPAYSVEAYYSDIKDAVRAFCPRAYEYVFWKHSGGDRDLFDELYARHLEKWRERKPPLKLSVGIEDEIREISRRFAIAIAGQYGRDILDLLKEASILDCFAHRFTQDDFSITKPDPRYLEQIAGACGVDPLRCIMVGDRIDKDVIPAKQVGMKTILIRVGLHRNQQPRIPSEIPDAQLPGVRGLAQAVLKVANEPERRNLTTESTEHTEKKKDVRKLPL